MVSEYSAFKLYDKDLILAAFKDSEVMYEGNGLVTSMLCAFAPLLLF